MKLDITLDRAINLRLSAAQVGAFDNYVASRRGLKTRTDALRCALWLGLAALEAQSVVEAEATLAAAKARALAVR